MATRYFISLSILLALLDQTTKFLAKQLVSPEDLVRLSAGEIGAVRNVIIPDFLYLTLNFNKGIAWGMLPQWNVVPARECSLCMVPVRQAI
ncbi:MAG: signal peptidase II [bacterium]|nr:signal peptidase II [bacterium]